MDAKSKDFDKLLLESIDETLLSLGEAPRKSIYAHLERTYNVTKGQIPDDMEHFQLALEKIFGIGARYLEILVMQNLYAKIQKPLLIEKVEQIEFVTYIETARQSFIRD